MKHHYLRPAPKRSTEPVPHTAYQVDFAAKNCGKIVAASKRVIRFKFGYTNEEALAEGKTGQDCRGSEHEVLITWSLSSGKQAIAFDQHEVYFDVGDTTQSKISHAWKDKNGHTLKVKIHAANMSTKSEPDPYWKQYDLLIDGVSFFRLPKIFELGTFSKEVTNGSLSPVPFVLPPSSNGSEPSEDIKRHAPVQEQPVVVDLLSFDDFDSPEIAIQNEATSQVSSALIQAPIQDDFSHVLPDAPPQIIQTSFSHAPTHYLQSCSPQNAYLFQAPTNPFENASAQTTAVHAYAPSNPFETSYDVQNNTSILATPSNPFDTPLHQTIQGHGTTGYHTTQPRSDHNSVIYSTPNPVQQSQPQPHLVTPPAVATPPTHGLSASATSGIDAAMNKLVNFDNILSYSCPKVDASNTNSITSIGQLHGGQSTNQKKCVMNPFDAAPVHQGQHQQQQVFNKFAAQQPLYNNYVQPVYAQPGFGYQ